MIPCAVCLFCLTIMHILRDLIAVYGMYCNIEVSFHCTPTAYMYLMLLTYSKLSIAISERNKPESWEDLITPYDSESLLHDHRYHGY